MHCIFHPEEFITNFCESEKCLLPLCPVCVKLHSEEHIRTDHRGVFELIDSCITKTSEQLRAYRDMFTLVREKTQEVDQFRQTLEAQLVDKVKQARTYLYTELDARFAEFESEVNQILDQKELDFMRHIEDIHKIVDLNCSAIDATLGELSQPESCLNTLIQYYYFKRERSQDWDHSLLSCNDFIRAACESRSLNFRTNPESVAMLRSLVSNFMSLSPESLPLPTLELPIVTFSSRTRYVTPSCECMPLCSKMVRC